MERRSTRKGLRKGRMTHKARLNAQQALMRKKAQQARARAPVMTDTQREAYLNSAKRRKAMEGLTVKGFFEDAAEGDNKEDEDIQALHSEFEDIAGMEARELIEGAGFVVYGEESDEECENVLCWLADGRCGGLAPPCRTDDPEADAREVERLLAMAQWD